jgi:hypothetical protein
VLFEHVGIPVSKPCAACIEYVVLPATNKLARMEATHEQNVEGLAIVQVLAAVLDRLVIQNASIAMGDPGQVTKFHAMKAPGIGVLQYLERIHKYASCSSECFILALIYIDRLIQRNNFLLTDLNVHRVVITAVLLAAKFFDDAYYNNAYYAKIGGVLVSEINGLEVDFLFRINFSLHVTPDVFDKYRAQLWSHSAPVLSPVSDLSTVHQISHMVHQVPHVPQTTAVDLDANASIQHHLHSTMRAASHITPSPPADARMNDTANLIMTSHNMQSSFSADYFQQDSDFRPVPRSDSVPGKVNQTSYYHPQVSIQRCAQNLTYPEMSYLGTMETQFYPTQLTFAPPHSQTSVAFSREGSQRLGHHMLSGAAL